MRLKPYQSQQVRRPCDRQHSYNKNFVKTKIRSYGDEVTDFHDKELPKVDSNHTCLAVISLESALKKEGNYYLQVFLKECKYIKNSD